MSDDTISRQAAIDAFYDAFCYAYCDNCEKEMNEDLCGDCHRKYQNWSASKKIIEKVINNLPSAQPEIRYYGQFEIKDPILISEQQWIPVSERLPEDYTDVLVWFEYFRYGNYNCLYQMYGIGSYSSEYDSWLINQETGWNELKVFAWMPLPEPYKGE